VQSPRSRLAIRSISNQSNSLPAWTDVGTNRHFELLCKRPGLGARLTWVVIGRCGVRSLTTSFDSADVENANAFRGVEHWAAWKSDELSEMRD
jgi:hypothetical protein